MARTALTLDQRFVRHRWRGVSLSFFLLQDHLERCTLCRRGHFLHRPVQLINYGILPLVSLRRRHAPPGRGLLPPACIWSVFPAFGPQGADLRFGFGYSLFPLRPCCVLFFTVQHWRVPKAAPPYLCLTNFFRPAFEHSVRIGSKKSTICSLLHVQNYSSIDGK